MSKHKHAELIKAWADGAEIEVHYKSLNKWYVVNDPAWSGDFEFRVKPKKPTRFLTVKELSDSSIFGKESLPHENVETHFKLHELVQEYETDFDNQDCEVYKCINTSKYKQRSNWTVIPAIGIIRMSKECAKKLCEMLNNGEIEL